MLKATAESGERATSQDNLKQSPKGHNVISANKKTLAQMGVPTKKSSRYQKLAAIPEKSNRQIADDLKVSHHTVESVRNDLEGCGQIAHVSQVVDTLGRKQETSKKPPRKNKGEKPLATG